MIFNRHGYFRLIFIVMVVVGNFYFSIFLRLTWEFLDFESERGSFVCWPNNKIIDNENQMQAASRPPYHLHCIAV